jgi:phosphoserine phosphatase RsbU/P
VLLSRGGSVRLTTGGPILGAFGDATFEEETRLLQDGDTIVMFTDGVTEARNARDEEFGDERLMTCLNDAAALPPSALLQRIFATVTDFCHHAEQVDDITATVTRFGR